MSKVKFKVGDRVGLNLSLHYESEWDDPTVIPFRYSDEFAASFGKVLSVTDTTAKVEWEEWPDVLDHLDDDDDDSESETIDTKKGRIYRSTIRLSHLLPAAELAAKESKLEVEFKKTSKEIRSKLKEAAKIIGEAQKLAKKQGHNLSDMYDAYGPLYNAMDNAGWRTSSFGC